MSKKFIKGLILVMAMVVLCLAIAISAGATNECPHNNVVSFGWEHDCELGGITYFDCLDCDFSGEGYLSPRNHGYVSATIESATCSEAGYIDWVCWSCPYGAYREIIPALGHDYSGEWEELLPASCYDRGVKINQCTRCNKVASEIIDRLPHTDADADEICDDCSTLLSGTVTPDTPETPDNTEPEQPEKEANVFSFLTEFLNNIIDFFKKLFKLS